MKTRKMTSTIAVLISLAGCGQIPTGDLKVDLNTVEAPTSPDAPVVTPTPVVAVEPTPAPTPSDSPLPPPTVVSFIFQNSIGICDAVRNWNPATTTIKFPAQSGNLDLFTFAASGITISDFDGSYPGKYTGTITKQGAFYNPPVCTITIYKGQLVSIK